MKSFPILVLCTLAVLTSSRQSTGCKLVVEKYRRGKEVFARVRMIYQSNEQLRNMTVLDYKKGIHPCSFEIPFKDLEPTSVEGIPFYDWKKFTDKLDTV